MESSIINLKRILKKRGYKIGKYNENILEFTTNAGKSGKAIWSDEEKEGKKYLTDIFAEMVNEPKKYHVILIYNNITNPALKIYNDYFASFFDSEIFDITFLQKFIFDHPLVPDVKILSTEEANKIIKEYGGDPKILPYILVTDPVALCMNLQIGDIIEETSHYDHSLKQINLDRVPIITYRYCIKNNEN
jgi:DNA-directed RNA polymerase subunit H (RpoH/RPB5)